MLCFNITVQCMCLLFSDRALLLRRNHSIHSCFCLFIQSQGSWVCFKATLETTWADCFPKHKLSLSGAGRGWSRWLTGHTALAWVLSPLFKNTVSTQGPAESHMSGICMGEIGLKWVTHDSFCLSPDSCNRPSSYWTNMIRLRMEWVFKAFPMWNLWRKLKNKEIFKGILCDTYWVTVKLYRKYSFSLLFFSYFNQLWIPALAIKTRGYYKAPYWSPGCYLAHIPCTVNNPQMFYIDINNLNLSWAEKGHA